MTKEMYSINLSDIDTEAHTISLSDLKLESRIDSLVPDKMIYRFASSRVEGSESHNIHTAWHCYLDTLKATADSELLDDKIIKDLLDEPELHVRLAMMEKIGYDKLLNLWLKRKNSFTSGVLACLYAEDDYGSLYYVDPCAHQKMTRGFTNFKLLKVSNSTPEPDGSRKAYVLPVPPDMRSPKQAIAWTFGLEEDEYNPSVES